MKERDVTWVDVHDQNQIVLSTLNTIKNVLKVLHDKANKEQDQTLKTTIEEGTKTLLLICRKHEALDMGAKPKREVLVTEDAYMSYYNTFRSLASLVADAEKIQLSLNEAIEND